MSKFSKFSISTEEEELEKARNEYWERCQLAPIPAELDRATSVWVKSLIDRNGWLRSKLRNQAVQRARVARGVYECQCCRGTFAAAQGEVDHAIPKGYVATTLDEYAKLCLNPDVVTNWICKPCHKVKTQRDKARYGKK